MDRFELDLTSSTPDARPDALGEGVVWSLTRPLNNVPAWSPRGSVVGAVGTLGVLPAIAWPRGWEDFLAMEREVFETMIHWLDGRVAREKAAVPKRVFPWQRPRRMAQQSSRLLIGVVVGAVVVLFFSGWWILAGLIWNAALSVHFFRLTARIQRRHRADTRWVVRQIQAVARREKIPVQLLETDGRLTLPRHWFFVALAMSLLAQPWGMALAMAGASRARVIHEDGPEVRKAMAVACCKLYRHWNPGADPARSTVVEPDCKTLTASPMLAARSVATINADAEMKIVYVIFAVVGWTWTVLVFTGLVIRLRRRVEPEE